MKKQKEIRGGILRVSSVLLREVFADFFTGKIKLTNKGLILRGVRRIDSDLPLVDIHYDFAFMSDDLPIIPEGCNPKGFLVIKKIENKKNSYKLVEEDK